jgi:hypothetical protein
MRDVCSLWHIALVTRLVRRIALLPNGRWALIRRVTLLFPMRNMWVPNG